MSAFVAGSGLWVLLVLRVWCVSLVGFFLRVDCCWHLLAGDGDWFQRFSSEGEGSVVSGFCGNFFDG